MFVDGMFSQDVPKAWNLLERTPTQATCTVAAIVALQVMGLRKQGGQYKHFD